MASAFRNSRSTIAPLIVGAFASRRAPARLVAAYRATRYIVCTSDEMVEIRVGRRSTRVGQLLAHHGVACAAFLTAYNLGSKQRPDFANHAEHRGLQRLVHGLRLRALPGEGIGEIGDWPPEPSLLILDVDLLRASRLARTFGQLAWMFVQRGRPAKLIVERAVR